MPVVHELRQHQRHGVPVTRLALLAALASGCVATTTADLARVTSGQIGCPVPAIAISDDSVGVGSRTWTARCGERTYYCSGVVGGPDSTPVVACKGPPECATEK